MFELQPRAAYAGAGLQPKWVAKPQMASGKRTLAVKMGDGATRQLYLGLLAAAAIATLAIVPLRPWVLVALIAAAAAVRPVQIVRSGATGRALVPALIDTGRLELAFGVLFATAVVVGR